MSWRNRIVGHGFEDPTQLCPNPANWKIHPTTQQEAIDAALDEIGWVGEVMVNVTTRNLVDGHMRVLRAIARGELLVPVTYVELSINEERIVLQTLDPIGAMAVADKEIAKANLQELNTTSSGLQQFLSDLADREKLFTEKKPRVEPPPKEEDDSARNDGNPSEPRRCPHCGGLL